MILPVSFTVIFGAGAASAPGIGARLAMAAAAGAGPVEDDAAELDDAAGAAEDVAAEVDDAGAAASGEKPFLPRQNKVAASLHQPSMMPM